MKKVANWTLAVVLGVLFVMIGAAKMGGRSGATWAGLLAGWGYPYWSRYAIGGVEILSGLGLLAPASRRPAAVAVIAVMLGAIATHVMDGDPRRALTPLSLGLAALLLYIWRTKDAQPPDGQNP